MRFTLIAAVVLASAGTWLLVLNDEPEQPLSHSQEAAGSPVEKQPILADQPPPSLDEPGPAPVPVDEAPDDDGWRPEGIPPPSEFQQKQLKLPETEFIDDPRAFIDQYGMTDLSWEQRAALAMTLQSCAEGPLRNPDALGLWKAELYGNGAQEDFFDSTEARCAALTDDEILASYDMVRNAAEQGDWLALEVLMASRPPEIMKAQLYGEPPPLTLEQYNREYSPQLVEMLDAAVAAGNVNAANHLMSIYRGMACDGSGCRETGIDQPHPHLVETLAYERAVRYVEGNSADPFADMLEDNMSFYEIELANTKAVEILEAWAALDTLVVTRLPDAE